VERAEAEAFDDVGANGGMVSFGITPPVAGLRR
jgi:hypothetical protein